MPHTQNDDACDSALIASILVAFLIRTAHKFIERPAVVIAGFKLACKHMWRCAPRRMHWLTRSVASLPVVTPHNIALTSISSRVITGEGGAFFADMAAKATLATKRMGASGKAAYPISSVNILKAHGRSAEWVPVPAGDYPLYH